jgi:hypothetical protein
MANAGLRSGVALAVTRNRSAADRTVAGRIDGRNAKTPP